MHQKIVIWLFVVAMVAALSTGCTTGPETQSGSKKNQENTGKKSEGSDYYN